MYSLLNRLAWVISFLIVALVFNITGITQDVFYFLELWIIIPLMIPTMIVKRIFFSSYRIEKAIEDMVVHDPSLIVQQSSSTVVPVSEIRNSASAVSGSVDPTIRIDESPYLSNIMQVTDSATVSTSPKIEISKIPEEPSKIGLYLHSFFSDRPLAKVGGILLFLGALFFLWLVFAIVGPVGKTLIGLAFGFALIATGVWMDHRGITTESRVLFGVGIAVNYLTILSGRYLLGSGTGDGVLLSESMTTIALLLNTGLAIAISLVFRSRVLLGFAFIFAYLTPFLVGSSSSSVYLLVIYTTILTVAIALINSIYTRLTESENIEYLQWIGVAGMTILLSLATLDANTMSVMVICGALFVSVAGLLLSSYRAHISLIPVFAASYIVLFASTFVTASYFIVPLSLVALFAIGIWLTLQTLISVGSIIVFGALAFALSLIGYIADGGQSISMLFVSGSLVFALFGVLMYRTASLLLGSVALLSFAGLTLVGITVADPLAVDLSAIISTRAMAMFLLVGASIFTIRLRDGLYFLMAIILSGILVLYPDTFAISSSVTVISLLMYGLISLIIPYLLMRNDRTITHRSAILVALPVSALAITTGIYQIGHIEFPGLAMGVAYIIQAAVYLAYGMVLSSRILPAVGSSIATLPATQKTDLLVLFALPLSLFTLALAFVFGDLPGMMSLAWVLESTILYLVYTRLSDIRIYIAACFVFLIGIVRQVILVDSLMQRDYISLAILALAMVSVFISLYLLRSEKHQSRMLHDIIHIGAVLGIGYGISRIIPVTTYGWSLLGISTFILVLASLYRSFGQPIHRQFLSVIFVLFCFFFLARFDALNKIDILPLIVQFSAISVVLAIGYSGYRSRDTLGYINLAVSIIGGLIISSLYIDHFFGVFAVSIYLTIIAAATIIRGISLDQPILRTIGLYIGTFALAKILGYDLWQGNLGAIARVFALMIAGGLMMYLSQLYGKYVSRSWHDEFSLSNILGPDFGKKETPTKKPFHDETPEDIADINPFTGELGSTLATLDVSDIAHVEFVSPTTSFTVRRSGVIRLARYITDSLHKTEFAPGELTNAKSYVLGYLQSNLPTRDLESMITKIQKWIGEGGSVTFVKK